ncbi:MAG: hypothetical protein KJP06_02440 [Deltaproteobacteria bacterium]|nr:hypothetical protein [Deltaproteobacteria bacterium]
MQQFLVLADKIPWIMAPAIVIAASVIIAVLVVVNRLLAPASKAMLVALMLALSAWAMVMKAIQ